MKVALAQLNYHIANFRGNCSAIIENINQAKSDGAELIIFSELSICGYPPFDLLEYHQFIDECEQALNQIAEHCTGIAAIVGVPTINPHSKGKKLFNSACFLNNGKVQEIVHKTLLPTYDIFDEYRYFEPNSDFKVIEYKNKRIALTICEDIWDEQPVFTSFGKSHLYTVCPLERIRELNPDLVINISASPFSYNQVDIRENIIIKNAKRFNLPLIYVNQVGAQTELIFDGGSMVVDSKGQVIDELALFQEDFRIIDLENLIPKPAIKFQKKSSRIEMIHDALVLGIRDYFRKMNFNTAILGLSGGIDSAVTLVLAVNALGNNNVRVLLMPSRYSSEHSIKDARDLAENLGIKYEIVPIDPMVRGFENSLEPLFMDTKPDITEENIQARIRGTILMAVSNKFGNILLNTTNKSEAAVGYGTLYGDMNGGLAVLGDVYKTDVYELSRFINRYSEIIPKNTLEKPPSAELRPDQKDSDSLPEYSILDSILFNYIELQKSATDIIKMGYDSLTVERVIRLVNSNEYKRYQAPPMLRISSKAFGFGRRMPLVAKY